MHSGLKSSLGRISRMMGVLRLFALLAFCISYVESLGVAYSDVVCPPGSKIYTGNFILDANTKSLDYCEITGYLHIKGVRIFNTPISSHNSLTHTLTNMCTHTERKKTHYTNTHSLFW